MDKENKSNILKNLALVSQIGISMAVSIIGGILLGNYLDKELGTGFIFFIIFLLIGIASAFLIIFKISTQDVKKRK